MLLMVEKVITGGICHSIYWHAINKKKYMKDDDTNKELHLFSIVMLII